MKNRKIGIEALGIDVEGGARTVVINMIGYLQGNLPDAEFVVYLSREEPELRAPNIKQVILPFRKGILSRIFLQLYLPFDVLLRRLDLIHFTKSQANLLLGPKKVMTIHDLTILQHPEIHSKISVFFWKHIQPLIAKRMDAVITVSEDAARDILTTYRLDPDKFHVIYNTSQFDGATPVDPQKAQQVAQAYSLPPEYFFYVGILALKKNLDTLIEAYKLLDAETVHLPHLLLAGPHYPQSDGSGVLDLVAEYHLEDKIRYLGRLPREDLFYIFRGAKVFIFPSYHEGFGIPCLEAMQLGVPVVASKVSAVPEVLGSAGVLIEDYLNPQAWAHALQDLNTHPEKRQRRVAEGLQRYQAISEKHSLSALVDLYQALLKKQ